MISSQKKPGQFMASEILEAPEVFSCNAIADHSLAVSTIDLSKTQAFYTIARGSSDAGYNRKQKDLSRSQGHGTWVKSK